MPRSMVGLLAAVGTVMLALVPYAHGVLAMVAIADGAAAGLVASLAAAPIKKIVRLDSSQANEYR